MSRSGEHYMPRPDAEFAMWANHYASAVAAFYDAQGLDPAGLAPLEEALAAWNEDFPAHVTAQAAAQAARRAKDAARAALERRVRPVTAFVQAWGGTTNADRAEMGIAVRPAKGSPAPAPTTRPRALVDVGQRLTHRLRLVDEATPTRRARPAGVQRAELFVALTEPGLHPAPARANRLGIGGGGGVRAGLVRLHHGSWPQSRASYEVVRPDTGGAAVVRMVLHRRARLYPQWPPRYSLRSHRRAVHGVDRHTSSSCLRAAEDRASRLLQRVSGHLNNRSTQREGCV